MSRWNSDQMMAPDEKLAGHLNYLGSSSGNYEYEYNGNLTVSIHDNLVSTYQDILFLGKVWDDWPSDTKTKDVLTVDKKYFKDVTKNTS